MKRLILIATAAALLAGCQTPGAVQQGPGIYETPITADRVRIVHRGPPGLHVGAVEDAALLRAAERTLANGFDWFVVDQRYNEVVPGSGGSNGPFISFGGGSSSFGRHSASGVGAGIGFNLGGQRGPTTVSTLEVRMGRGAPPEGAYVAREVQQTIGGRMGGAAYPR